MHSRPAIQLLSDEVINKIAAGEVIDRPASVLKELMENAIDAGGMNIEVAIIDGGRKMIAVSDDGCGMSRDDAVLCVERHATSKLRSADDLEHVATLGFRGEALAAIAAVSRFTISTRRREETAGNEVVISGGRMLDVHEVGVAPGTTMSVRHLFFNVPARRRFLRSDQTELAHLRQVFLLYALSYPEIGLRLSVDEREVHRLMAGSSVEDRLRELMGPETVQALRPVDFLHEGVRVRGFASLPHTTRADRSEQYVFVNRRPASAPAVGFAIHEAYAGLVPRGRHPLAILFIEMDAASVDVNVHPTKKEVRFRHPSAVRDAVMEGIRSALSLPPLQTMSTAQGTSRIQQLFTPAATPAPVSRDEPLPAFPYPTVRPGPAPEAPLPGAAMVPAPDHAQGVPIPRAVPADPASHAPWAWSRVIGQIGGGFVVLETPDGLVLLDPQSAHERVLYERYLGEAARGSVSSQGLLAPETISLPPDQARMVRKNLPALQEMGIGIGEFGGDAFVVDALPSCLGPVSISQLLSDLAAQLSRSEPRHAPAVWLRDQVAQAACRASVQGRRPLRSEEIDALVAALIRCEMPYTCPHGRPTVVFMGYAELNKKFGRG